jgi:hypothetical protein
MVSTSPIISIPWFFLAFSDRYNYWCIWVWALSFSKLKKIVGTYKNVWNRKNSAFLTCKCWYMCRYIYLIPPIIQDARESPRLLLSIWTKKRDRYSIYSNCVFLSIFDLNNAIALVCSFKTRDQVRFRHLGWLGGSFDINPFSFWTID